MCLKNCSERRSFTASFSRPILFRGPPVADDRNSAGMGVERRIQRHAACTHTEQYVDNIILLAGVPFAFGKLPLNPSDQRP